MKAAWAIVCSLVLVAAQLFAAPLPASCAKAPVRACCHCGGKMSCCRSQSASNSQPVPANSVRTGAQNQFLLLTSSVAAWVLPDARSVEFSFSFSSPLTANGAPLFARDCARLI